MNEEGLRHAVKALGGSEQSRNVFVVWKKGCIDPVKYIIMYKEDGGPEDLEMLKGLLKFKTKRDVYLIVNGKEVIGEGGPITPERINDEYLKALLSLAEKLS